MQKIFTSLSNVSIYQHLHVCRHCSWTLFFDTASNEVPLCEMFLAGRNQHPPINALFQDPIKGIKDVNHTSSETIANCLKIKVHFTKEVPLLLQHNLANQGL